MSRKVSLDLERSPVGIGIRKVGQWITYDQFTDGAGASGYIDLSKQIPAGSYVLFSKVTVTEGFAGDTTAVMDVGNSADTDDYSFTDHNVFAAAANLMEPANGDSGDTAQSPICVTTATTVRVTVTGGSDFGAITAGKAYVEVVYISTNPEVIDKIATRYDG